MLLRFRNYFYCLALIIPNILLVINISNASALPRRDVSTRDITNNNTLIATGRYSLIPFLAVSTKGQGHWKLKSIANSSIKNDFKSMSCTEEEGDSTCVLAMTEGIALTTDSAKNWKMVNKVGVSQFNWSSCNVKGNDTFCIVGNNDGFVVKSNNADWELFKNSTLVTKGVSCSGNVCTVIAYDKQDPWHAKVLVSNDQCNHWDVKDFVASL